MAVLLLSCRLRGRSLLVLGAGKAKKHICCGSSGCGKPGAALLVVPLLLPLAGWRHGWRIHCLVPQQAVSCSLFDGWGWANC